jgi:hypothetical protein
MSFIVSTVVIFAAAVLFTPSSAAPTAADLHTLPHVSFNPAGQIQQDSVPDPGIGDYFTGNFDGFTKIIGKILKNRDPEKIEEVRKFIKRMRTFVTPGTNFIQLFYPNDIAANNVMKAINTFLASLEKMVDQPTRIAMSQEDVESLAKLMRTLEAVN